MAFLDSNSVVYALSTYIANSVTAISVNANLSVGDHPVDVVAFRVRHHPQVRRVVQAIRLRGGSV